MPGKNIPGRESIIRKHQEHQGLKESLDKKDTQAVTGIGTGVGEGLE